MIRKFINLILLVACLALVFLVIYKQWSKPPTATAPIVQEVAIEQQESACNAVQSKTTDVNYVSRDEVNDIVKDYIISNPEIILTSLEGLHNKKINESAQKASSFLKKNKNEVETADAPPFLGNKDGDIIIVVFYDYNCSFCKKAHEYENEILIHDPGVKLILRPTPILGENSVYIAKVALALYNISPENFFQIHGEIMQMAEINETTIRSLISKYNIEYSAVENEINSYAVKQLLEKNFALAKELDIKGTPSYVINGHLAPGLISTEKLKNVIMQLRATTDVNKETIIEDKQKQEDAK